MGKEVARGPLVAAFEHSKATLSGSLNRAGERKALAENFDTLARNLLDNWGARYQDQPDRVVTPEVTIETGRGDVILCVLGSRDAEGQFTRVSLESRYGEFKLPFIAPKKPLKPSSVKVQYDESGQLLTWKEDLPRIKKLRKAIGVLEFLTDHYKVLGPQNSTTTST